MKNISIITRINYSSTDVSSQSSVTKERIYDAEVMANATNSKIYVVDFHEGTMPFISKNGYLPFNQLIVDVDNKLQEIIEDLNDLIYTDRAYFSFLNSLPQSEKTGYSLISEISIKTQERHFLINRRLTPYLLDEYGDIRLAIGQISLSPLKNKGGAYIFNPNINFHYFLKDDTWEKVNNPILTEKEVAILSLSLRGFTTQEISDIICRSIATIKTHKNDILKKLNASNMIEALSIAKNFGYL